MAIEWQIEEGLVGIKEQDPEDRVSCHEISQFSDWSEQMMNLFFILLK